MAPTAALIGSGALALFLAGCGDSGDDVTENIGQIAGGAKELSTLVAALNATDLVGTVSATKDITVFAPTNDAFGALDKKVFDCLLQPVGLPTLKEVLEYHVVPVKAMAADLKNNETLATLDGKQSLTVMLDGKTVTIDAGADSANVTTADIKATNGVVHEVDAVLLPADFVAPECGSGSIADTAVGSEDLSTLVAALSATGLVDTFNGTDVFTVFAPTNDAFAALPKKVFNCLLQPVGLPTLSDVLKYHVVSAYATAGDLKNKESLATLDGNQNLTVMLDGKTVTIDAGADSANVTTANIYANNGVVHEVNAVLLPADFVAPECGSGSIADTAVANKDLSTLVAALAAADLVDTFNGTDVFTVFAPTNEAFALLGADTISCLLDKKNVAALTQVLTYHVVAGYDLSSAITDGLKVTTLEKEDLTFNTKSGVEIDTTSGGKSNVTIPDVYATNGVVHVVDAVLIPKDFADNNPCAPGYVADAAILV